MITQLISRIKVEQEKLSRSMMERPTLGCSDNNMLRIGQWQGMEQVLQLIEELLIEPEDS